MSQTLETASEAIKVATEFVNAPLPVIVLVAIVAFAVAIYKINKIVIEQVTTRERRYGKLKAIAVAHKAKNEDVTPEMAMLQINEALKDD